MGDKKRQDPKGKFHKIGLRIFAAFASRFFGIVQNDSIPPIRRAYGAFGSYCKNTVGVLQYGCAVDCSHIRLFRTNRQKLPWGGFSKVLQLAHTNPQSGDTHASERTEDLQKRHPAQSARRISDACQYRPGGQKNCHPKLWKAIAFPSGLWYPKFE